MKKIKLSVFDDFGNISFNESPIWKHNARYSWTDIKEKLGLKDELVTRINDWRHEAIGTQKQCSYKEDKVKCEIEGLSILLELRKELPDYEITYSSNFNSYHCVLNEEQIDDSY